MDKIDEFLSKIMRGEDTNSNDIDFHPYNSLVGNTTGKNTIETVIEMLQNSKPKAEISKSKVERIYEDDDWVIDKVGDDIRVSYFNDFHFVDEKLITKEQFESKN